LKLFVSDEQTMPVRIEQEQVSTPPVDSSSIPDRWEVLERIDRGELTAEEAVKILVG
jgi:hypothetical protein